MSISFENKNGWFISHLDFLTDTFKVAMNQAVLNNIEKLFEIPVPFISNSCKKSIRGSKKRKFHDYDEQELLQKAEIDFVKAAFEKFVSELKIGNHVQIHHSQDLHLKNTEAQKMAEIMYRLYINPNCNYHGCNDNSNCIVTKCHENTCIFPPKSQFFNCDVREVDRELLSSANKFNLILMDPPWWNKYIRRKKRKCSAESYDMMYNEDLLKFPMEKYLDEEGIVLIWCTNARSHIDEMKNKLFPAWNLEHVATWYWIKVTTNGEVVCPFSGPCKKQPFERILIACKSQNIKNTFSALDKRLILSVPSAIHSHKPPLSEILKTYLPENPKCLELFARYLLPGWTSIGNEVLKFQCYPGLSLSNKKIQSSPDPNH